MPRLFSRVAVVSVRFALFVRCYVWFWLFGWCPFSIESYLKAIPPSCDSVWLRPHGAPCASCEPGLSRAWTFHMCIYCPWKTNQVALLAVCASDTKACGFYRCWDFVAKPEHQSLCDLNLDKLTWKSSQLLRCRHRCDGTWDHSCFLLKFGTSRLHLLASLHLYEFRF